MRTLDEAIADAQADPDVTWFDVSLSYSWRREDGPVIEGWEAIVGGVIDGEEWDSREVRGSDGAEVLDRARTTEREP